MARVEYRAGTGAWFTDENAQRYGEYLSRCGLGKRVVPTEEIVALAADPASPIHGEFEWDDEVAGHQYRLDQARKLVRHIVVAKEVGGRRLETRAFHRVTSPGERAGYVSERIVWERPDLAAQVRERAFRELQSWRDRYRQYQELESLVFAVEKVLAAA